MYLMSFFMYTDDLQLHCEETNLISNDESSQHQKGDCAITAVELVDTVCVVTILLRIRPNEIQNMTQHFSLSLLVSRQCVS